MGKITKNKILITRYHRSTSQATRIADSKAGKMSGVVAGLCIAAGVAGVAGGLGLGMGLEEEKTVENDESST